MVILPILSCRTKTTRQGSNDELEAIHSKQKRSSMLLKLLDREIILRLQYFAKCYH